MPLRDRWTAAIATALLLPPAAATARPARSTTPTRLATCDVTPIAWVGQRLEDAATHRTIPDSGSQVRLADGVWGVSYDQVAAINGSRVGDPAIACLVKLPTHCPPGDARGKWYTTTNLRTLESWTLPDSEHECGGA